MKGLGAAEVIATVETLLARKYSRLVANRFFEGTLLSVAASGAGYLCTLSRTNETKSDGGTYFCSSPSYVPAVGDIVECVWLDANVALVLWPKSRVVVQTGTSTVSVLITAREGTLVVAFPTAFPLAITPRVFASVQNINATVVGERPVSAQVWSVSNTGFSVSVDLFAAAAAQRDLTVAWRAIG